MIRNTLITAIRLFFKYKAYSFTNIFGLAIGLATCILIFLYVQYETSYDDYFEGADNIYRLEMKWTGEGEVSHWAATTGDIIPAVASRFPEIQSSVKFYYSPRTSVLRYEDKVFRESGIVHGDSTFLDVFSLELIKGDKKDILSGPEKILLSETAAKRYFGNEDPIGKMLRSESRSYMVKGVFADIPENSHVHFDLIIALDDLRTGWTTLDQQGPAAFYSYIKVKDEETAISLKQKMDDHIWEILGYTVSGDSANIPEGYEAELLMQRLTDIHLEGHAEKELEANGNKQSIYIFSVVALFVLIIACINYMNLATARSANRGKEIGVKKVLGANRSIIFNQFIGESVLLSFLGMLLALLLVDISLPLFNNFTGLQLELNIFNNSPLLISAILIWLIVGFLSGSYPAVFLSAFNPLKVLYSGTNNSAGGNAALYLRRGLVIFQFTISILLIIGVITVYKQLGFIHSKSLGFIKEQVIVLPLAGGATPEKVEVYKNEIALNPSVISASGTNSVPGVRIHMLPFRFPDLAEDNPEQFEEGDDYVGFRSLSSDLDIFETYGLEIIDGREFSSMSPDEARKGFVLNEAAVAELGFDNPVGRRIEYVWGLEEPLQGHIIGVVKNFHYASLHTKVEPLIISVNPVYNRYLSIRVQTNNESKVLTELEESWTKTFANIPFDHFFLETSYDNLYKSENNMASIILFFSVLAILIACLGLFGLASYITEQRTKEIGIRKVLGASIMRIIKTLSKEFVVLIIISNILAWLPAWYYLNRWLNTFTFRTSLSWWLFFAAGVISLLIALSIVGLQSYLAGRKNPVEAIKAE